HQTDCQLADGTFREIQTHSAAQLSHDDRLKHARCARSLGQYAQARGELTALERDAPELRSQIDGELKLLEIAQAQRQVESQAPARATQRCKKAKAAAQESDPTGTLNAR